MALNNLGMGLLYTVKDSATAGLARISAGITTVTKAASQAAAQTPKAFAAIGKTTGQVFQGGANAAQAFGAQMSFMGTKITGLAGQAESGFQRMAQAIRSPVDRLMNLKNVLTGVAAAWGGLKVVEAAGYEEQAKMALGVMLKNDQVGEMVFNKARKFGDVTPFDTQQVIQATRMAVSSKFTLSDIFQGGLLTDMGNLSAANADMGISINEVARVFGRLKAGDFGEAFERLRDMQIGFQDLQEAGLNVRAGGSFTGLDPDQVVKAVRSIIQTRFGGMMDKMQYSWQGVWSTFTSNITNTFAAIGQAKIPGTSIAVLDAVKERVNVLTAAMVDDEGKLTPGMQRLVTLAAGAFGLVGRVFDAFARGTKEATRLVKALGYGFGSLPDVTGGLQLVGTFLWRLVEPLTDASKWYTAGQWLRRAMDEAAPVLRDVWTIVENLVPVLRRVGRGAQDFMLPFAAAGGYSIWRILTGAVSTLADFAAWLNSGSTGANLLLGALEAIVVALTVKLAIGKVWELGTALGNAYTKAKDLAGALADNWETISLRAMYAKDAVVEWGETVYLRALYAKDAVTRWGTAVLDWAKNVAWANIQQAAMTAWGYAVAAAQWVATTATAAWSAAVEFLNLLFVATPIGWIVLGIGALIATVYLAIKYWDEWTGALQRFGQWVWSGLVSVFQTITGWFSGLPGWIQFAIAAFVPFIGIPLLIANHWDAIVQFFEELPARALEWGANFIRMFGQGIANGVQFVKDKVVGVASAIRDFLGFHSPTRLGPGSDAHRWAPNLMGMYADGIDEGIPTIQAATNRAANALSASLTPVLTPGGAVAPGGAETTAQRPEGPAAAPAAQQAITVIAKLVLPDGRELAEAIIPVLREDALLGFGG